MPLFTFHCTQRGQFCDEVEVLCSYAEARSSLGTDPVPDPLVQMWPARLCATCGSLMRWVGVELPQTADLSGNRGGNFRVRAITQAGEKIPLKAGRSSRTPKRGPR